MNVDEGFLPHFVAAFREVYVSDSVFVRATSDLFTNAVVAAMKANDLLVSKDTTALFACEEAEETLRALVKAVDGSKTLLQKACGVLPVSSFSKLVDSTFEGGCFSIWLREFEAEQFAVASGVIGRSKDFANCLPCYGFNCLT